MIIPASRHFIGSDLALHALHGSDLNGVIEEILGSVLWLSETEGFCACPGRHLHGTADARKDCKIYLAPVPTVSCFHSSCRILVEETTKELRHIARAAEGATGGKRRRLTQGEKDQMADLKAKESLRRRSSSSRHRLLRDFRWAYRDIRENSPVDLPEDPTGHWREVLSLFAGDQAIWVGALYQSGQAEHTKRFKLKAEWLGSETVPGHFICPSTFEVGSFARSKENIVRRAFLVVESDDLDKDTIGAVFRWMRDKVGLNLRCIVDTGGKSLHGWFDFPADEELDELKIILPELGCDPKMFTATQPCRLPGALRGDRHQKLIFLAKEATDHE